MPIEKRKVWQNKVRESENHVSNQSQGWSDSQLTWRVIAIWIVLVIFIIFTFSKFNTLVWWNNTQDLERKITKLESEITTLKNNQRTTVWVHYGWWADSSNNVSWIWEKSLWYPSAAKWKTCYIIWEKLRGVEWWAIWWYLWIAWNGWRYNYSTQYEANLNNFEQKIEIIKNVWSDKNLTMTERNNLYLSLTLLCR